MTGRRQAVLSLLGKAIEFVRVLSKGLVVVATERTRLYVGLAYVGKQDGKLILHGQRDFSKGIVRSQMVGWLSLDALNKLLIRPVEGRNGLNPV